MYIHNYKAYMRNIPDAHDLHTNHTLHTRPAYNAQHAKQT